MANTLAALIRRTNPLIKSLVSLNKQIQLVQLQSPRFLYCEATLGIDGFRQHQEKTRFSLERIQDKFKTKMTEYSSGDSKNMIFTEDLKNMIHITQTDEDVDLVIKMMKKFNQQNKELRFGNFVFGPVVMRMFHVLNKPDEALQCFKAQELEGFFDQLMSYQLLMDLLYENKKYSEMLDTFKYIQSRQIEGTKFPRNILVLVMAACYKLNTPESFTSATEIWTAMGDAAHFPMRRATTFYAGLALNQGHPEQALEIVGTVRNQTYTTVRNLKVLALISIGRLDDAIPILKSVLIDDKPTNTKHTFSKDAIEKLKTAVEASENSDLKLEFSRLEKLFQEQGHISNITLDEQLCSQIVQPFISKMQQQQQPRFSRYQKFNPNRNSRITSHRPGLSELQ